jgi:hypothetical protein
VILLPSSPSLVRKAAKLIIENADAVFTVSAECIQDHVKSFTTLADDLVIEEEGSAT